MNAAQILALCILAVFYLAYFTKVLLQRRAGIKTDQIGKGDKPTGVLIVESLMKIATYAVVMFEIVSIVWNFGGKIGVWRFVGLGIAALGVAVFLAAMVTMRDSWRAGIPATDKTALVTHGIYRVSRNPAFLGFDLMYLGLLLAFFHYLHLIFVLFAVIMLHLQILQEETFLCKAFGAPYADYRRRVGRYFLFDGRTSK